MADVLLDAGLPPLHRWEERSDPSLLGEVLARLGQAELAGPATDPLYLASAGAGYQLGLAQGIAEGAQQWLADLASVCKLVAAAASQTAQALREYARTPAPGRPLAADTRASLARSPLPALAGLFRAADIEYLERAAAGDGSLSAESRHLLGGIEALAGLAPLMGVLAAPSSALGDDLVAGANLLADDLLAAIEAAGRGWLAQLLDLAAQPLELGKRLGALSGWLLVQAVRAIVEPLPLDLAYLAAGLALTPEEVGAP